MKQGTPERREEGQATQHQALADHVYDRTFGRLSHSAAMDPPVTLGRAQIGGSWDDVGAPCTHEMN